MSASRWTVSFQVFRKKDQQPAHFDTFTLEVDPDEYVLDAVERLWAFHDRSLVFRHACHHSACGACGMRVNGVEKLTCITTLRSVTRDGGRVRIEPLRNFPVVSDLAVDMGSFYMGLEQVRSRQVAPLNQAAAGAGIAPAREQDPTLARLVDCLECGMCVSACPVALTDPAYQGPAALASIQAHDPSARRELLPAADQQEGVWRCHSAFECSAVCPSNVEPAWRIMDLRKQVLAQRIRAFFYGKEG